MVRTLKFGRRTVIVQVGMADKATRAYRAKWHGFYGVTRTDKGVSPAVAVYWFTPIASVVTVRR